ncbi:MAG: SagB/ThcOx family dehydrogenase [Beijerinckiaceae bacterium]
MTPLPKPDRLIRAVRLDARQSARDFMDRELTLEHVSVLLFAAQGRRHDQDKRLVPSAGARYPLELTLAVRRVESLQPGLYRYAVDRHGLNALETNGNPLPKLAAATFEAPWVANAAAVLHISAVFERTTTPYADQPPVGRAERYIWLEAGHAAQNPALAAAALQLATVFIGGFDDAAMARAVQLSNTERSIGLMPLGFPV